MKTCNRQTRPRSKTITSPDQIKVEVVYVETEDAEEIIGRVVARIWKYGKSNSLTPAHA